MDIDSKLTLLLKNIENKVNKYLNNQKQVLDELFEDKQNIQHQLDQAAAKFSNNKANLSKLFKGIP